MSKIIKSEAKAEDKLLKNAMKDLHEVQKIQKRAVNDESSALKAHSKAVKLEHKLNKAYLDAKAKYENAAANLNAKTEKLEAVRQHAQQQTALLHVRSQEVDQLRTQKATDDRERQAKLAVLNNPSH